MSIQFADGGQHFRSRLVQIQNSSKTSSSSTNSTTFSDTGLSRSIAMSNASNAVLVLCNGMCRVDNSGNTGYFEAEGQARIMRGSTHLRSQTIGFRNSTAGGKNLFTQFSFGFIDTPGSGTHTYKLQFGGGGGTFRIYVSDGTTYHNAGGVTPSCDLTLIEFDT